MAPRDDLQEMNEEYEQEYDEEEDDYYSDDYYYSDEEGGRGRGRAGKSASRRSKKGRRGQDLEEGELEAEDFEASFDDVRAVLLTRKTILSWIKEPFFDDALAGQFLRLSFGNKVDPTTGDILKLYVITISLSLFQLRSHPSTSQIFRKWNEETFQDLTLIATVVFFSPTGTLLTRTEI